MRTYHHLGIPTTEPRPGEVHLPALGMFVLPRLVQELPHVAFKVDDIEAEIVGKEVLIPPNSPSPGVRVAFIVDGGAPVEFLQIDETRTTAAGPREPKGGRRDRRRIDSGRAQPRIRRAGI